MIAAALFSPTIVKTAVNIRGKKKKKTNFSLLPFWTSVTDWTSPFLDGWMNRINWLSFSPLLNFYFTPLVRDGNPIDKGCVCVCVCSFQASFVSVSIGQKMFNEIQTYICTPAPPLSILEWGSNGESARPGRRTRNDSEQCQKQTKPITFFLVLLASLYLTLTTVKFVFLARYSH
jgi:hypothetical protein